jgi:hypothetical protein
MNTAHYICYRNKKSSDFIGGLELGKIDIAH